MARFIPPIVQLGNDSFSGPASGWKLNFYDTGTLVRKDTFSDTALTIANTNPVIADSAGRFGNIFLEAGLYRIVLTDEVDVQKWDADPVDGSAGVGGQVLVKTANYTVTLADLTKVIAVDATAGAITITLLAAATAGNGAELTVKKTDSSANAVTVDGNGAETIDGVATQVLGLHQSSITLRCDGTNWLVAPRTQEIIGAFALQGDISPAQITANQNNFNPTDLAGAAILRLNSDASRTITGLAGGADGRVVVIENVGSFDIVLADEDSGSTAANRFALSGSITLLADTVATLNYDATSSRWRMLGTSAISGADVQTFDISGTWTKPAGRTIAIVDEWGAGGSGGVNETAGGGGGAYSRLVFPLSALGATETITIGAGGPAVSASGNGNAGGNTTFGALSTIYGGGAGGGGGTNGGGGGGGGQNSAGGNGAINSAGAGGGPLGGAAGSTGAGGVAEMSGGGGGHAAGGNGGYAVWGGAGGSGMVSGSNAGNSKMGGAGGGGARAATSNSGGTSEGGGNGGAGGAGAAAGTAGSQPGGGGGASGSGTSGKGGDGRIIVTTL